MSCTDCREISGGQVQAALRRGVGLRRQYRPLGDESGGDLRKTRVFRADQVGGRHPHVVVGQLSGVRGAPAHLLESAGDAETRRALLDDQQRHPGSAIVAGTDGGDDE